MQTENLSIEGPAGTLQLRVETPEEDRGAAIAVVCHPHPLRGGTMENKVVHTMARGCQRMSVPTVRFNFRGVGESAGEHDHGDGEQQDALAVCAWATQRWPGRPLWLLGFSFGGAIAARIAVRAGADRLVTVAPPMHRMSVPQAEMTLQAPWLIVHGDADEIVPIEETRRWMQGLPVAPRLVVLPGVGHFFHGRLPELLDVVSEFLLADSSATGT